jgi:plastocyanin
MRRLSLLALVAAFGIAAVVAGSWSRIPDATAAQSTTVRMQFNAFDPAHIVVAAGTTVTWTNEDWDSGEFHDVIAANGAFASETFGPGGTFSVYLEFPGWYEYYCDLHEGMYGTVTVE